MECETRQQTDELEAPVGKKMRPSDYAEYDSLVDQLADRLNIARHPDSSITIKAARLLVEHILSSNSDNTEQASNLNTNDSSKQRKGEIRIQKSKFNLSNISLPTMTLTAATTRSSTTGTSGDVKKDDLWESFMDASRALKLLYLSDQKHLQNQVNEIISTIQSLTANPKTDSRLLASGR